MLTKDAGAFGRWTAASLLLAGTVVLGGCADGSGSGTTTSGTTGGTTSGTTGGTTSGTTGGTTSGTTGGTTSGTTGGTTSGTTGGATGGIVCNPTSSTYRPLQTPNATAVGSTSGLCLGCVVNNPGNVVDSDITTFTSLNTPVGLLGASSILSVNDTVTTYPANVRAGFVVANPAGALLTLSLLQTVTVTALNNNVVVDSSSGSSTLALDLLGTAIIGTTSPVFLSFKPTAAFNGLALSFGSTVNALASLNVFQACVAQSTAIP